MNKPKLESKWEEEFEFKLLNEWVNQIDYDDIQELKKFITNLLSEQRKELERGVIKPSYNPELAVCSENKKPNTICKHQCNPELCEECGFKDCGSTCDNTPLTYQEGGVSAWRAMGKKYGYFQFFERRIKEANDKGAMAATDACNISLKKLKEKILACLPKERKNELDGHKNNFDRGFNLCRAEFIKNLKEKDLT